MNAKKMFLFSFSTLFLLGFTIELPFEKMVGENQMKPCFYSLKTIQEILDCQQCEDLRLYNTINPANSSISLMAVSVSKGADLPGAPYWLFRTINGNRADIVSLSRDEALRSCSKLEGQCFAVTFKSETLMKLLDQEGATGISFIQVKNAQGNATLKATPAYLSNGRIIPVPEAKSTLNEYPCPNSCGQNPSVDYLCPMK